MFSRTSNLPKNREGKTSKILMKKAGMILEVMSLARIPTAALRMTMVTVKLLLQNQMIEISPQKMPSMV